MKWSEKLIARAIATQLLQRKCIVLVDNCNWTGHECDVLGVTMDMRIIDVEVKISRADLKADAKKDKWWHRHYGAWNSEQRIQPVTSTAMAHPRKVWKHYYAMPKDIWKPELLDCLPSQASGILLLREGIGPHAPTVVAECIRRATPAPKADRLKPEEALNIARLANLRMWEAYHRLEAPNAPAA